MGWLSNVFGKGLRKSPLNDSQPEKKKKPSPTGEEAGAPTPMLGGGAAQGAVSAIKTRKKLLDDL